MNVTRPLRSAAVLFALGLAFHAVCQEPKPEFMSLEAAGLTLSAYSDALPAELRGKPDEAAWSGWIKSEDASIRERLLLGEEDTITNLLRWGVTYTNEYQINREYLAKYGTSTLVNAFAEKRAS